MLLSVHCDNGDWVSRAKEALQHTGGQDIGSSSEKHGDFAVDDKPHPRVKGAGSGSIGIDTDCPPVAEYPVVTEVDTTTRRIPVTKVDDVA